MSLIDWFFPSLCVCCSEKTSLRFFCEKCWQFLEPLDPSDRCRICFSAKTGPKCPCLKRQVPFLRGAVFDVSKAALFLEQERGDFTKEIASFFFCQWVNLDWEKPDILVAMPEVKPEAKELSLIMEVPFGGAFLERGDVLFFDGFSLEESTVLLLDQGSSLKRLQKAAECLLHSFTKKIFQLSLIHHDYFFD